MNETIYDAQPTNFFGRLGLKFLEALDLSNNLVRVTKALKGVPNGSISLLMAVGAFLALLGFGSLAYYFDLDSTWSAMSPLRDKVTIVLAGSAIAGFAGWLIQTVPTALTVLPTVSEMLGSRFARFSIPAFQAATWMFVFWDLATDVGRVNETINPHWSSFVQGSEAEGLFGILFTFDLRVIGGAIGFYVTWVLALLGASYFLELITVLCLWAFVALLWKSLGYWGAKVLAGKANFMGDLGGTFDPDYRGDKVHTAEAANFGGTATRGTRARSARRAAPAAGPVVTPIYTDDSDVADMNAEEFEQLFGGVR